MCNMYIRCRVWKHIQYTVYVCACVCLYVCVYEVWDIRICVIWSLCVGCRKICNISVCVVWLWNEHISGYPAPPLYTGAAEYIYKI